MKSAFPFAPLLRIKFWEESVGGDFCVNKCQVKPVGNTERLSVDFRSAADENFRFASRASKLNR